MGLSGLGRHSVLYAVCGRADLDFSVPLAARTKDFGLSEQHREQRSECKREGFLLEFRGTVRHCSAYEKSQPPCSLDFNKGAR